MDSRSTLGGRSGLRGAFWVGLVGVSIGAACGSRRDYGGDDGTVATDAAGPGSDAAAETSVGSGHSPEAGSGGLDTGVAPAEDGHATEATGAPDVNATDSAGAPDVNEAPDANVVLADAGAVLDGAGAPDGGECIPDNTSRCAQSRTGMDVLYPKLDDAGLPLGNCRLGTKTCGPNGTWGECIGAVGPTKEVCDRVDNDCNGLVDDQADDVKRFWYDADNDLHASQWASFVTACFAPTTAPADCAKHQTSCPASTWTSTALPSDDCDDNDPGRYPGAPEKCNRIDDDCSNTNGSKEEPLEDQDQDGYTSKDYASCSGGFPKTDCLDTNADVHPNQTKRFDKGYCLNSNATNWCFTERRCAAKTTCADSMGQVWGPGSVDYNCDGVEEPFAVLGTDSIPYSQACAAAPTSACEGPTTPSYAISANAACGAVSQHMQCKPNSAGTACEYASTFLMTACR